MAWRICIGIIVESISHPWVESTSRHPDNIIYTRPWELDAAQAFESEDGPFGSSIDGEPAAEDGGAAARDMTWSDMEGEPAAEDCGVEREEPQPQEAAVDCGVEEEEPQPQEAAAAAEDCGVEEAAAPPQWNQEQQEKIAELKERNRNRKLWRRPSATPTISYPEGAFVEESDPQQPRKMRRRIRVKAADPAAAGQDAESTVFMDAR